MIQELIIIVDSEKKKRSLQISEESQRVETRFRIRMERLQDSKIREMSRSREYCIRFCTKLYKLAQKQKAQKFSRKLCGAAEEFLDLCNTNIVDPRVFYEGPVNVGVLLNTFFSKSWEDTSWPELEWFTTKL